MKRLRSILPLILVLVTTLLVSCGSSVAKAPPTYTADAVDLLQRYVVPIETARDRMPELGKLITQRNWPDVENFIHGPLGELRHDMSYITRSLLPEEKEQASELSKDIFGHIERIDAAAKEQKYSQAASNYNEVIGDIDAFINIVPSKTKSSEPA